MRSGTAIVRPADVGGLNWVSSWDFTSFPRRGRKLRFRLYAEKHGEDWETLADFLFPNPAPGPYPVWQSVPLPFVATNTNDAQSWTSPELEVENGALVPMKLETNFDGFQLALQTTQSPFNDTIRLKLSPPSTNSRLLHPRIVDNQGRQVEYQSGGFEGFSFDAQWKIPIGAKWITVTTRLVEIRHFEFTARPTRQ